MNVLVSGLLGGMATDVIRRWRAGAFDLIISQGIAAEYEEVLKRPKFGLSDWVVQELLDYIRSQAQWVESPGDFAVGARNPSDNKFLAAAVLGKADWIVSGDNDLLELGKFEGVGITSPREFLSLL
jgi:putative PIN family toxin of toxin-antitoxin system